MNYNDVYYKYRKQHNKSNGERFQRTMFEDYYKQINFTEEEIISWKNQKTRFSFNCY